MMKRLKFVLTVVMIGCILFGLWFSGKDKVKEYTKTEYIMDTVCSVTFYGDEREAAAEAVFDEIRRISSLTDMYNDNSEVSRINKASANERVKVSSDTYKVLETALKIGRESRGAFDITVAPLTILWDFCGESEKIPSDGEIKNALSCVGLENIILENGDTVYKLKSETKIDLGGAAKGYAGDKAVETAKKFDLTGGIIDLGGNIFCFGENPNNKTGKWTVGIQIPFAPAGTYEKTLSVSEQAVVTGGTYQRYFKKDGKIYHHILDPKTGYPAEREYSGVTVKADSSLEADCLATALFVMGKDGVSLAKKYNGDVYFE